MEYPGKRLIPGFRCLLPTRLQMRHGSMIQLRSATSISIRRLLRLIPSQMRFLCSATTMHFRTPLMAAFWRSASTVTHSRTSLAVAAAFFKAVTMVQSAPVAAIRWQVARRGQAVLVALSRRQWACPVDTPVCCGGGWAVIAALLVKAGGSILSR